MTEPEAIAFAVARRPASPPATRADLDQAVRARIGPFDADKDGRVTLAEVLAAANASAVAGPNGEVPLARDAAPLSRQAYGALVDALFTAGDADGDGVLSLEEANALRARHGAPLLVARRPARPVIPATGPVPPAP
ncbi:hypothetical protein ACI7BZ_11810 [Xanthobacter sp. AM11]|uniref:hypothetical protein n=1 Tax=Xanthobacter sp. AM11 TaxID=3380643 RepID=UPI0039BF6D07